MLITGTWRKSSKSGTGYDCAEVRWRKSSFSADGDCAEVAIDGDSGVIEIRNSKNPDAGTATFTRSEWVAFIGGVKNEEFEIE